MPITLLIPDDYQRIATTLPFLQQDPTIRCHVLGDLAREPAAAEQLASAEALILIRERTLIDAAFLRRAPNLRLISQTGKLARNIDLTACTDAGVAVVEGVGSPVAPAELTWLLVMAARRKLVESVNALRAGHWQGPVGESLEGQILGILGYGKIGKRLAGYGRAFGMQVLIWGSERAQQEARADDLMVAKSRAHFFAECDVLSVHQRLVSATAGNITAADLAAMKPTALFVNTSRAELVAPGALLAALQQGRPGFAALDVFDNEPIYDPAHPLLTLPNVLCTPHLGYAEQRSYELYFHSAFANVQRFLAGDCSMVLNPAALDQGDEAPLPSLR